jgi:methionyl-tRNA synthetase
MQPWKLAKEPARSGELQDVCSVALNLYRQIVLYMSPVLPHLAEQSATLFGAPFEHWSVAQAPLTGVKLQVFKHLMVRVEPRLIQSMLEASVEVPASPGDAPSPAKSASKTGKRAPQPPPAPASDIGIEPILPICSVDDFAKLDLRVARVLEAEAVEGSKKLLRLRVSLGNQERTIFAGIQSAYEPAALIGRLIVILANLSPRQMKCGTSEGMALAAGAGGSEIFLLAPDSGAVPGQRVH